MSCGLIEHFDALPDPRVRGRTDVNIPFIVQAIRRNIMPHIYTLCAYNL